LDAQHSLKVEKKRGQQTKEMQRRSGVKFLSMAMARQMRGAAGMVIAALKHNAFVLKEKSNEAAREREIRLGMKLKQQTTQKAAMKQMQMIMLRMTGRVLECSIRRFQSHYLRSKVQKDNIQMESSVIATEKTKHLSISWVKFVLHRMFDRGIVRCLFKWRTNTSDNIALLTHRETMQNVLSLQQSQHLIAKQHDRLEIARRNFRLFLLRSLQQTLQLGLQKWIRTVKRLRLHPDNPLSYHNPYKILGMSLRTTEKD